MSMADESRITELEQQCADYLETIRTGAEREYLLTGWLEAARAEVERLRADEARLDWLESFGREQFDLFTLMRSIRHGRMIVTKGWGCNTDYLGKSFRDAIDTARAKKPTEPLPLAASLPQS